jgi:hypothetical protein
VGGLLSVSFL